MTALLTGKIRPIERVRSLGPLGLRNSLAIPVVSELFAGAVGFGVMVVLARRLGPLGFADYEYATAVAAWWLVLVRGGCDTIVYREAARRPRLIRPLTDALIGLRAASTLVALAAVFAIAWVSGRGLIVAVAALIFIPSSLAADVGLRATCRFRELAWLQASRTITLAISVAILVRGSSDALSAAGCLVGAEAVLTLVLWIIHRREHGPIRLRIRRRTWACLARRGLVTGALRFGRVSLYAADILVLGSITGTTLGPYAAARRVAFALLALGLVVPSAVAPRIARAWASGAEDARRVISLTFEGMMAIALPATVGLIGTADRWMPRLFGEGFAEGGPWLALIVARLPFVLASNLQQSALIACRRESWAARLILGMVGLGVILIPWLAMTRGPWGVGLGVLAIEAIGAYAGWWALRQLGIGPRWHHASIPACVGSLALAGACVVSRGWPLGIVVVTGSCVYAITFLLIRWFRWPRAGEWLE